jgi:hypothetical protein
MSCFAIPVGANYLCNVFVVLSEIMGRSLREVSVAFAPMSITAADMRQPLLAERLGPRHSFSLVARDIMPADNTTLPEGWNYNGCWT